MDGRRDVAAHPEAAARCHHARVRQGPPIVPSDCLLTVHTCTLAASSSLAWPIVPFQLNLTSLEGYTPVLSLYGQNISCQSS
jgi:hypothetical protein